MNTNYSLSSSNNQLFLSISLQLANPPLTRQLSNSQHSHILTFFPPISPIKISSKPSSDNSIQRSHNHLHMKFDENKYIFEKHSLFPYRRGRNHASPYYDRCHDKPYSPSYNISCVQHNHGICQSTPCGTFEYLMR